MITFPYPEAVPYVLAVMLFALLVWNDYFTLPLLRLLRWLAVHALNVVMAMAVCVAFVAIYLLGQFNEDEE